MILTIDKERLIIIACIESDGKVVEYECKFNACQNPVCTCTELTLLATTMREVDSNVRRSINMSVVIDIDTKELALRNTGKIPKADQEFASLFFEQLDDEDFKILHMAHSVVKHHGTRMAPARSIDFEFEYDEVENSGLMISYNDVLPFGEQLLVKWNDNECILSDYFCLASDCGCTEVTMFVSEVIDGSEGKGICEVSVDYRKKKWRTEQSLSPNAVSEIRAATEEAFPNIYSLLKERHKRIKEIYLHCKRRNYRPVQTNTPTSKVSRNAPCPCGSGRKYKKCCGRV